ncbi:MAG: cob(I)yrinic acid a,c-diamide adenosyltransferase [Clostridia bacterium]|nr:MAG: cob(I)yrinic acid a,c-diamide adenosyltransferase [Clostridia bacterium]
MPLNQGLIQVYTGNAKGKSTAAFGLAVRAAGHGLKVHIVQFMKTGDYGENKTLARLAPEIEVRAFGRKGFIHRGGARAEDYELAVQALDYAREIMLSGRADVLILDEINNALYFGLLPLEAVLEFLAAKPPQIELVLTGRNAPREITERADLVTEMLEVKHPYQQGIGSRAGIEY